MAKVKTEKLNQFINDLCVKILNCVGYEIPETSHNQKLRFHCGLILTSLAMLALSFVSLLNGVGWLVFVFHSVNIFYKLIILRMQMRTAVLEAEKEKQGLTLKVSSPYHTQFNMLIFLLIILSVVMLVTIIYKGDHAWFIMTVALSSLLVSSVKEVLDGLVSLYNATGTGHYITKKRNW